MNKKVIIRIISIIVLCISLKALFYDLPKMEWYETLEEAYEGKKDSVDKWKDYKEVFAEENGDNAVVWVGYNDFEVLNLVFETKNRNNKKYYQCMMIESPRLQDKFSPNNDYYKMKEKFLKGVVDFIPNIKVVERKNYVECKGVESHLIEAKGKEYIVEYSKIY